MAIYAGPLLRCMSLLVARNGHAEVSWRCPLLGERRKTFALPRRVVCLGHPAVQYHDLHGAADAECAPVLCPIRTGSYLRTYPGQNCRLKTERSLGRRSAAPRQSDV